MMKAKPQQRSKQEKLKFNYTPKRTDFSKND